MTMTLSAGLGMERVPAEGEPPPIATRPASGTSNPATLRMLAAERDQAAQVAALEAANHQASVTLRDTIATYRDLMEAPSA